MVLGSNVAFWNPTKGRLEMGDFYQEKDIVIQMRVMTRKPLQTILLLFLLKNYAAIKLLNQRKIKNV